MRFTPRLSTFTGIFAAVGVVNAHFNISYPPVRGPFNDDNEVDFCDSYNNVGNRSEFPLNNGLIAFITSHPSWTVGVLISTDADPSSFSEFHNSSGGDQLVVPYFKSGGTAGCLSVNVTDLGLSAVTDGANVTLQMAFNGGDGILYQCMDLTLSSSYQVPSDVVSECKNETLNAGSVSSTKSINSASKREMLGLFGVLIAGAFAATSLL